MALQPLSVGDILMLSQTAWKIGRAFTNGQKSAPAEFGKVEREANGLSEALKLVAETLHSDGSILSQADDETNAAVNIILESARRTLSDLESFVERYQVISKKETNGGFLVERSWAGAVLANYKTFKWTTEGGNINDLRNMLQMLTNSIQLIMQALQSRSLSRLEKAVMPMAERITSMHDRINGDLGDKIDDLHTLIMSIANSTPSLTARDRAIESGHGGRNGSTSTTSTIEDLSPRSTRNRLLEPPTTIPSYKYPRGSTPAGRDAPLPLRQPKSRSPDIKVPANAGASMGVRREYNSQDSAYYSIPPGPVADSENDGMDWAFESGSPPDRSSIAYVDPGDSPNDSAYDGHDASSPAFDVARRESSTLPNLFKALDQAVVDFDSEPGSSRDAQTSYSPSSTAQGRSWRGSSGGGFLGPPAISMRSSDEPESPATPSTFLGPRGSRQTNNFESPQYPVRTARAKSMKGQQLPPSLATNYRGGSAFEKQLFRNAAILCDVRGKLVEYAQTNPDEPDPRYAVEMVSATQEARICVIRRNELREHGGTKTVTSIWALSQDGEHRMQQKLSDVNETVPFCSYFEPEKVSLQPTDGPHIALRFHAEQWGEMLKEVSTCWLNVYLSSEHDAVAFQSAVFGRKLIGSYRTTKTTVIHEGLKGTFAFEEQFANIEMLRLWEDDGLATPGAAGGVLALMHISSNFGVGWARWWINNCRQEVKVREDGVRHAKVKGIDITVVKPGGAGGDRSRSASTVAGPPLQRVETDAAAPQRRVAVKKVHGIRIEFKSEEERGQFVSTARRVQERSIPLPEP